ncbi:MAG: hypothetical protein KJ077_10550 [Anaerolineae bacterium]|nr:hypothetical protein [Anaerolineae bacterium]
MLDFDHLLTQDLQPVADPTPNEAAAEALDEVAQILDRDAYSWLQERNLALCEVFEKALRRGVTPKRLNSLIRQRTRRPKFAAICEQAIRYIHSKLEAGTW